MLRILTIVLSGFVFSSVANAQTMTLQTSSSDYQVTNIFSDVDTFDITVVIDAPLAAGSFVNPDIVSVSYAVSGTLVAGTPSGFPAFALQRDITGDEFYAQGSSLSFTISPNAVLSDGVQVAELVGSGVVLTYNAREVGNGRFHPALLEVNGNGTGRIQNSDNVISENPLQQVDFGEEYINDLMFDPGNTTVITGFVSPSRGGGGGGAFSGIDLALLALFSTSLVAARSNRRLVVRSPD